jgi:hypothetical protein
MLSWPPIECLDTAPLKNRVRDLYERRPYPHYPIWSAPRLEDAYLGSPAFNYQLASRLLPDHVIPSVTNVLSFGCGEMLPYMTRNWCAPSIPIDFVDLSLRSLQRARLRNLFNHGQSRYFCGDILTFLQTRSRHSLQGYTHVEAYGVLHHSSRSSEIISNVALSMAAGGRFRVMVYNTQARQWIHHLTCVFKILGLNYHSDTDCDKGRHLLQYLTPFHPPLKNRLSQVGSSLIENNTRFADTFLHPYVSRKSIAEWFSLFERHDLLPVSLYDRYGELDDLDNPLWKMPSVDDLMARARDLRFENNLEILLLKMPLSKNERFANKHQSLNDSILKGTTGFPSSWQTFPETKNIDKLRLLSRWHHLVSQIRNSEPDKIQVDNWETPALKRLARLGAILPLNSENLHGEKKMTQKLLSPIHPAMDPPTYPTLHGHEDKFRIQCCSLLRKLSPNISLRKQNLIVSRLLRIS